MLRATDPEQARGRDVSAREVLDNASALVQSELAGQPDVAADVNLVLAEVFGGLGLDDRERRHLDAAIEAARRAGPEASETLAQALLGSALGYLESGAIPEASANVEEAQRVAAACDPVGQAALELVSLQAQLADAQGRHEDADLLYRQAAAKAELVAGPASSAALTYKGNLSVWLLGRGGTEEAIGLQQEVVEGRRAVFGENHPDVALSLNSLGSALRQAGQYKEAEARFREALKVREAIYDPEHPYIGHSLNSIAATLRNLGDRTGAEPYYRRALDIYRKRLGPAHPRLATMLQNLASLRHDLGDLDEAAALFEEALAMQASLTGGDDLNTSTILSNVANLQIERGQMEEAEASARKALNIRERLQGPQSPQVGLSKGNLASILIKRGRHDEAEPLLEEALAIYRAAFGERHPNVAAIYRNQAQIAIDRGSPVQAETLIREALSIYAEKVPTNIELRARCNFTLAAVLEMQGRRDEAQEVLIQTHADLGALPDLAKVQEMARAQLEKLYLDWGREADAQHWAAPGGQPVVGGG